MSQNEKANRRKVLKTIGAGIAAGTFVGSASADGGLDRELAEVRAATAKFNDVRTAEMAGYESFGPPICGMGYHYVNSDLVDPQPVKTQPEVMVYGEDDDGSRILGAVEYMVPKVGPYASSSPDLFKNADPHWHTLEVGDLPPLWTLHAWVHNHNPEGVFHDTNPRELFHPDNCVTE